MDIIDLRSLRQLQLGIHPYSNGEMSLRLGSPEGQEIARSVFPREEAWDKVNTISLKLPPAVVDDLSPETDLYLVWLGDNGIAEDDMGHHRPADVGWLDWIEVK